ncbi:MAG: hypothetical protein EXX96DRAFT_604573 [Benjaminiella poitrasii]|nr:MAG: hypothetical protein EXX96DRAFT_604573 [Benjaminiella poitrasii]
MADTLVDDSTEYLVSDEIESEISPETTEQEEQEPLPPETEVTELIKAEPEEIIDVPKEKQDDGFNAAADDITRAAFAAAEALKSVAIKYNRSEAEKLLEFVPDSTGLYRDPSSSSSSSAPQYREYNNDINVLNKTISSDPETPLDDTSVISVIAKPVKDILTSSLVDATAYDVDPSSEFLIKDENIMPLIDDTYFEDTSITNKDLRDALKVALSTPDNICFTSVQTTENKEESYFTSECDNFSPKQVSTFDQDPPPPPSPSHIKRVTAHYERRSESKKENEEDENARTILAEATEPGESNTSSSLLLIQHKNDSDECSFVTGKETFDSASSSSTQKNTDGLQTTASVEQREPDILTCPSSIESNRPKSLRIRNLTLDELYVLLSYKLYKEYVNGNQHAVCIRLSKQMEEQPDVKLEFESLSSEEKRIVRQMSALNELIITEKNYSSNLSMLCTYFFQEINLMSHITEEERQKLVCNALDIASFHIKFTNVLVSAHDGDKSKTIFVPYTDKLKNVLLSFIEWAPKLEIYHAYCVNYDLALAMYNNLLSVNPKFKESIDGIFRFHSESLGISKLKFQDYLAIPFQRLFKYEILLQTIAKATKNDTEEYKLLIDAQKIIHAIVKEIDQAKSEMETRRKKDLFLSRLRTEYYLDSRWFGAFGECLLIGTLVVRLDNESKASDRVGCALFNYYMIIAEGKKADQYESKHWFSLHDFNLVDLPNNKEYLFYPWRLESSEHVLELCTVCESEKKVWMERLDKAINDSRARRSSSEKHDLDQFFVSSFQLNEQKKRNKEKSSYPSRRSFSTSTLSHLSNSSRVSFFDSVVNPNKRISYTSFSPRNFQKSRLDASNGSLHNSRSPTKRPLSVVTDVGYFASSSRASLNLVQYQARCKTVDMKFNDVCTTPILKARAMNSFYQYNKKGPSVFDNYRYSASALFSRSSMEMPSISSMSLHKNSSPRVSRSKTERNSIVASQSTNLSASSIMNMPVRRQSSLVQRVRSLRSSKRNPPAELIAAPDTLISTNSVVQVPDHPTTFLKKMAHRISLMKTPKEMKSRLTMQSLPSESLMEDSASSSSKTLPSSKSEPSNMSDREAEPSKRVKKKLLSHLYSSRQQKK